MNIILTEVKPETEIAIRTERSEYRFQVSSPARCTGLLTGGVLGFDQLTAYLVGIVHPEHIGVHASTQLEIGSRALFFLKSTRGMQCLTTSIIVALTVIDDSGAIRLGNVRC